MFIYYFTFWQIHLKTIHELSMKYAHTFYIETSFYFNWIRISVINLLHEITSWRDRYIVCILYNSILQECGIGEKWKFAVDYSMLLILYVLRYVNKKMFSLYIIYAIWCSALKYTVNFPSFFSLPYQIE